MAIFRTGGGVRAKGMRKEIKTHVLPCNIRVGSYKTSRHFVYIPRINFQDEINAFLHRRHCWSYLSTLSHSSLSRPFGKEPCAMYIPQQAQHTTAQSRTPYSITQELRRHNRHRRHLRRYDNTLGSQTAISANIPHTTMSWLALEQSLSGNH